MTKDRSSGGRAVLNQVRSFRERASMSQKALAEAAGVSRQAIIGIEGGGQVPSTALALRLADVLGCRVDDLFALADSVALDVEVALADTTPRGVGRDGRVDREGPGRPDRVVLGKVDDRWVAHPLPPDRVEPADAIVGARSESGTVQAVPLDALRRLEHNVLVAGCAPVLALLSGRTTARFADARGTWLPGTSRRSLDLLQAGQIHIAGVHLPGSGEELERVVRSRFPGRSMLIVNLTRWREGFVVAKGNPLGIRSPEHLLAPGVRFAGREEGAGAHRLVRELLDAIGAGEVELAGPRANGHADVAGLVRCGAADVGVAIEGVALAAGLDFVPLMEERFDLVVASSTAEHTPVARLLSIVDHGSFRLEMDRMPGYDSTLSGHVKRVDAA